MGKELKMARSEEERRTVLLAGGGTRKPSSQSASRDKRKKKASNAKSKEGGEIQDTASKSKGGVKTKRTYDRFSKSKGRGRDNKDRKSGRGDEGEDIKSWRSAEELGIKFPGSYCDVEQTQPHSWYGVDTVNNKDIILTCRKCYRHLALPMYVRDSEMFGSLVDKNGIVKGYLLFLGRRRQTKIMVAKLQDLWHLSLIVEDKVKFTQLVVAIMADNEYDRKEVSNG